jgi:hypothetical protein
MLQGALAGTVAGAAGTVALDVATYADMVLRGRPSSEVPSKVAGALTHRLGISLSDGNPDPNAETAKNRRNGIGSLMGYITGLGVGTLYGALRPRLGGVSVPLVGVAIGLAAMAASDVPAVTTNATDPKTWGLSDWISDLLPHLAYGLVTALTLEAFYHRSDA